jgi:hypothetical protein
MLLLVAFEILNHLIDESFNFTIKENYVMAKKKRKKKAVQGAATTPIIVSKRLKPGPMPKRIFAQASPRSLGGVSIFEAFGAINEETVLNFQSERSVIDQAANMLAEAGFEVLQVNEYTINIAGTQKTFEQAFETKLQTEERPVIKEGGREDTATFVECPETGIPGLIDTSKTPFRDVLEGVAIEEPIYFMAPSKFAPLKSYWHLRVPAGVSLALNADRVHRGAITGKGIKVAMVDSGHYKHPFFVGRGYRVGPVVLGPGASNPLHDESGHGTGESANIFSAAPDVQLLPVKINFVNSKGAFDKAVQLKPDIITCSWGSSIRTGPLSAVNQALATSISAAWKAGIVVIFAAGNGQWGFPGQHPEVISAGGVYMEPNESLRASNYASGFMSNIYPNRRVPDLCGLVGMRPKAIYIMLPLEPGDSIDSMPWNHPSGRGRQGGVHPNGDETAANDGWAAFSGTSAAAPQLAGVAALMLQACKKLKPKDIRDIMRKTARDVKKGNCSPSTGGHAATPGPDLATGNGLVDAHKAVLTAKIRCTVGPRSIAPRVGPARERGPISRGPVPKPRPPRPGRILPGLGPRGMAYTEEELASLEAMAPEAGGVPLTHEDVDTLEQMVIDSELGIEDIE